MFFLYPATLLVIITWFVFSIIHSVKTGNTPKIKYTVAAFLCVLAAATSWLFNIGLFRLILTSFLFPVIHTVAFLLVNEFSLDYAASSVKLKRYSLLSCITYLLFYVLMPDGGIVGDSYVFFGLLHNPTVLNICACISFIAFIANLIITVLQLIERRKAKRNLNKNSIF